MRAMPVCPVAGSVAIDTTVVGGPYLHIVTLPILGSGSRSILECLQFLQARCVGTFMAGPSGMRSVEVHRKNK